MRARHRSTPYLLIAPALAVFGGVVLVPIGLTARFSFYRWDGLGPFEAVGLAALFGTHPPIGQRVQRLRAVDPEWREKLRAA